MASTKATTQNRPVGGTKPPTKPPAGAGQARGGANISSTTKTTPGHKK